MGNVERCDKTLPTNEMIYHVRKSAVLRERWKTDLEGVAREFGLSAAELEAIRDKDVRRMRDLGVHQYYIPQILRLFFGSSNNSNASAALECYKRAFPDEFARSAALQAEHARRLGTDAGGVRPTAGRGTAAPEVRPTAGRGTVAPDVRPTAGREGAPAS